MHLKTKDLKGHPVERAFRRTDYVGDIIVPYVSPVKSVLGNYLTADLGSKMGNFTGMKCFVYSQGGTKQSAKAIGYVTMVTEGECTIEIQQFFGSGQVSVNDIIELDDKQWTNNENY